MKIESADSIQAPVQQKKAELVTTVKKEVKSDRSKVIEIKKKAKILKQNGNYPSSMKDVSLPIKFEPVNDKKICTVGELCHGWSLKGYYGVATDSTGVSSLIVDAEVTAPRRFKRKTMFGLGWGLAYGPNSEKTESYLAMWQYN